MRRPILVVIEAAIIIMIAIAIVDTLGLDLNITAIITEGSLMIKKTIAEGITLLQSLLR